MLSLVGCVVVGGTLNRGDAESAAPYNSYPEGRAACAPPKTTCQVVAVRGPARLVAAALARGPGATVGSREGGRGAPTAGAVAWGASGSPHFQDAPTA